MKTLQGYIFSRDFMGERAPQHVQNIVIRDYCIKNDFKYVLSATEYAMPGSDLMLKQIVQNFSSIDGVVAYSVFQMPEERQERNKIIELTKIFGHLRKVFSYLNAFLYRSKCC